MDMTYTERKWLADGLSEAKGPFKINAGEFLFRVAGCYYGVLPPFNMLKKSLNKGRLIGKDGTVYEWKPVRISRMQYDELKKDIKQNPVWGGEVVENYKGSRAYWERWAILRSLNKLPAYG